MIKGNLKAISKSTLTSLLYQFISPWTVLYFGDISIYRSWILLVSFGSFVAIFDLGFGDALANTYILKEKKNSFQKYFSSLARSYLLFIVITGFLYTNFLILFIKHYFPYLFDVNHLLCLLLLIGINLIYSIQNISYAYLRVNDQYVKFQNLITKQKILELIAFVISFYTYRRNRTKINNISRKKTF